MKATILVGTLKRDGLSNTATLCAFLAGRMEARGIACETIHLADLEIPPGTFSDMGGGDEWPVVLEKLKAAQIIIWGTPIWWGGHSSLIQRAIERLDELHDMILDGKTSPLDGKVGGIVITGDSDGAQHVIGNVSNFFNAIGILVPPYATLSVLWERQAKGSNRTEAELLKKYEENYADAADKMVDQLVRYAGR